jgi:hypothetical protein
MNKDFNKPSNIAFGSFGMNRQMSRSLKQFKKNGDSFERQVASEILDAVEALKNAQKSDKNNKFTLCFVSIPAFENDSINLNIFHEVKEKGRFISRWFAASTPIDGINSKKGEIYSELSKFIENKQKTV